MWGLPRGKFPAMAGREADTSTAIELEHLNKELEKLQNEVRHGGRHGLSEQQLLRARVRAEGVYVLTRSCSRPPCGRPSCELRASAELNATRRTYLPCWATGAARGALMPWAVSRAACPLPRVQMATVDGLFNDAMQENMKASERAGVRTSDHFVAVPSQPALPPWGEGSFEARLRAFQEDATQVYERLRSFSPGSKSLKLTPKDPLRAEAGARGAGGGPAARAAAPRTDVGRSPETAPKASFAGAAGGGSSGSGRPRNAPSTQQSQSPRSKATMR